MADNIFSNYIQPIKSVDDWRAEADARALRGEQLKGAQRQNALADMMMQGQAADMRDRQAKANALRALLSDPAITTQQQREDAMLRNPYLMDQGQAAQKARIDAEKVQADSRKSQQETAESKRKALMQTVGALNSPDDAMALINASVADGTMSMQAAQIMGRMIKTDPKWQVKTMMMIGDPDKARELLMPHLKEVNNGKVTSFVDTNTMTNPGGPAPIQMTTTPGQDQEAATSRANNAATVGLGYAKLKEENRHNTATESDGKTQVVNDPERGIIIVNKSTGLARSALGMDGKPVPSENAAKSTKQWGQLGESIKMARDLLPGATASGAGALYDKTANFFGQSTDGADAAAKLRTLAGWMTSNVPRMEGPQSDKDTANYRIMAGQVGDETIPTSQRLAALDALEEIRSRYAAAGAAPKPGQPAPNKPAKVSSDADYNALPSGALFVGPDGKTRRKP